MKNYLSAEIKAKGFLKYYFIFFLAWFISFFSTLKDYDITMPLSLILQLILILAYYAMIIAFSLHVISSMTYREKNFSFNGSFKALFLKVILGQFLSAITIGIYYPWFVKKIINYYLSMTEYDGNSGELLTKPERLLKYFLLLFVLPVIVLTVIFAVLVYIYYMTSLSFEPSFSRSLIITFEIFVAVFLIVLILQLVFIYFHLAWILKIRYGAYTTSYVRKLGKTFLFFLSQSLLTILTLFIYFPAAYIKICRFIFEGTEYFDSNKEKSGSFGFSGQTGRGFLLMWGQTLLTVITLGIYCPWAMVKVANWFINNIYVEDLR